MAGSNDAVKASSHADYVDKLKQRLRSAKETAARQVEAGAKEHKHVLI